MKSFMKAKLNIIKYMKILITLKSELNVMIEKQVFLIQII